MWYNIITARETKLNKTADVRKEKIMEEMTDLQVKIIINAIIQIIKDTDSKEEMIIQKEQEEFHQTIFQI